MQKMLSPFLTNAIDTHGDRCQFAYRKGVSCTDAIVTLVHNVVLTLNHANTSIAKVLFLDFSSAFNTVLPNTLLHDLHTFVEDPWVMHWLADFMKGWSRQIKMKEGLSEISEISVGVPHGGPLSALLFTIYTDEIRSQSNCSFIKYADDTAITCRISKTSHNVDQRKYESVVSHLATVCDQKNLLLNPTKSKELVFENTNIKHEGLLTTKARKTVVQGAEVDRKEQTVYLGVCMH